MAGGGAKVCDHSSCYISSQTQAPCLFVKPLTSTSSNACRGFTAVDEERGIILLVCKTMEDKSLNDLL